MASQESTETSDDFAARVGKIMVHGFTSFGICLGHQVGLFDVLADMKEPKTSQEIADAGNFKERYVREWLGAMVTSHIVELDSTGEKYFLPPNRSPALTQSGPMRDSVLLGSLLPSFGGNVYEQVRECFQKVGPRGVSCSAYTSGYSELAKVTSRFLENGLLPTLSQYPELKNLLGKGISVVDIGCGEGVSSVVLGKAFPNSNICAVDLLEESVVVGRKKAESLGLKNVEFITGDAAVLPAEWNSKFDLVFMHDALHDQAYPDKVLSEVYRVLAPGGIYFALEPTSYTKVKDNLEKLEGIQLLYMISLLHCMPTSLYSEGGMGLGAVWGREKAVEMISAAGMEVCSVALNSLGRGQHFYCKKK
ncbi:S-adenosylmethionine-dependent methyltransferase Rv2258c-like [Apostichopus japonicus]|uniref:S-adenosylmethionine-dependent methyltransferase Rv2258c-like n=1 Tax=Stichopus japonicus TaxID=307972 RepID=UPI003AB462A2